LVSFQLLRNMVKIWEQHFKQNKRAKKLPCIVPLVIYHGKAEWKIKMGFTPLFDEIPETKQYIPDFHYELFDISHIPEDNIRGSLLNKAFLLLLRSIFEPELLKSLPKIFNLLNGLSNASHATEYIELFIRYLVSAVGSEKQDNLTKVITTSLKDGGIVMPTIAEKWLQEGIEKGIEQGIEQGIERGKVRGAEEKELEMVEKMLQNNISIDDIRKITGMSLAKLEQIRKKVKKGR
jgi:predicted transposase/invertase (TIGR01784 family)